MFGFDVVKKQWMEILAVWVGDKFASPHSSSFARSRRWAGSGKSRSRTVAGEIQTTRSLPRETLLSVATAPVTLYLPPLGPRVRLSILGDGMDLQTSFSALSELM